MAGHADRSEQSDPGDPTAAETILRSLDEHGVDYLFGDFGTDHTPLLEAAAHVRADDAEALPKTVVCPDEAIAIGAAHGYAAVTGDPQAVVVHVDVGTQNLGAMLHDAHRACVPMFIFAGLTPMTETGFPGSRDLDVHYLQQVFQQPDIVREYTRWFHEFRTPEDPERVVVRGLERSLTPPQGPVYLTAAREPLEVPTSELESKDGDRTVRRIGPTAPDGDTVDGLTAKLETAEAPLLVTSRFGAPPGRDPVETLVAFAEAAGVGVVEKMPSALNFPRDHDLHVGFDTVPRFDEADLLVLVDTEVPWNPQAGSPPTDLPVIQIDREPTKELYPHWDFRVDTTVQADPEATLAAMTAQLDRANGETGREQWREVHERQVRDRRSTVETHREEGRFTPEVLTDELAALVDEDTVVLQETVTNSAIVLEHMQLSAPGSYHTAYGPGLGWTGGSPIGVKLAEPARDVVALVGDGTYVTANPLASLWTAVACDAPFLTVVYNNGGWNAVRGSVYSQHPDGMAVADGVPESKFEPELDFAAAADVVGAYSSTVTDPGELGDELAAALAAVRDGVPAVVDAKIESI